MKFFALMLCIVAWSVFAQDNRRDLEKAVEDLTQVGKPGFGYSEMFSGSTFLPRSDSGQWAMGVVGAAPPQSSDALAVLVKAGAGAISLLVKHLDDARPTGMKPAAGMMWTSWDDEYDCNRRTCGQPPKGVNRESFNEQGHPKEHQITVGDLCFVALGQIVNRGFNATRYQPTGGLVISSPTYSERLRAAVLADYAGMTAVRHREQLVADFQQPDYEDRRNGAVMRLAFYYPETVDDLITEQLRVPTFDVFAAESLVRNSLYRTKSPAQRKTKFEVFVAANGEASKDGVLLQLFDDLDRQVADEEHRSGPPMKRKYDARNLLVQLYGYPATISPKEKPFVKTWSQSERTRFIEAVGPAKSPKVIEAVTGIFRDLKDDDPTALACMKVLRGNGLDAELAAYCKRRTGKSNPAAEQLRAMARQLEDAGAGK